jgi:stage II sporulation SpoE-like protein
VTGGVPTGAGSRGRLAALCAALTALALAAPAAAQLQLQLPLPDRAVGDVVPGEVVEETVKEPLPDPVEDVVADTPVAPVRDEVRRVVGGVTGGGGGGGTGGGGNGTPATGAGQQSGGSAPSSQRGSSGGGPRAQSRRGSTRPGSTRRGGSRVGRSRRAAVGRTTPGRGGRGTSRRARRARPGGSNARARQTKPAEGGSNALTQTVDKIVEVVPRAVWLAFAALVLAALALGGRTFVERRRARVLEAEREQLRREVGLLERALLPEVPAQLGALGASVAYRPSEGPAAGGDFYDAFELPGGRAAVLVGDVSGHGPEALERTNSIRTGLHGCLDAGLSPRAALAAIGQRASKESSGRFATVVVAVHDPAAGTLTYAAAGHPAPILTGPPAHEPPTAASSPPIGMGISTGLRETSVPLPSGSIVCLFTDGLLEARVNDGMFGRERLSAMVAGLGDDEQADTLLEWVIATADESPDDMAVCILRPAAGVEVDGPRVEIVEFEAADLELGVAERFLASCGVPDEDVELALAHARATARSTGGALIEVTIDDRGARARVAAPEPLAAATPA